jgi:Ca2+-binding RTX toxin-like protein
MKHILLSVALSLHLFMTVFPPANCADATAQNVSFKASIDDRRTLHIEGTDASETIIAEVIGDPASRAGSSPATIAIEYRGTDGPGAPQKSSFPLDAFDRLVVNARGGADFVNIIDAAELLDSQKKILNLDGGDGDNIVALSHLPFKPETVGRIKQLLDLSVQVEDLAKRAGAATSQALANDATRLIDSVRVEIADVSRAMAGDAERQLFNPARALAESNGPRSTDLGNSIIAKSDDLAKQHAALVAELTKKYGPVNGVFLPDDDRGQTDARQVPPDADRPDTDPAKEKEAGAVRAQAERLAQDGLKQGDEAKAQVEQIGGQMESSAAAIGQRATEFERQAEQLSARAELIAASGETNMAAAAERVLAVVGDLKSVERNFREAGMALRDELLRAVSLTPESQAKTAKAGASGCNTPVATTQTYTGGNGSDFFFPISSPWQSWSISGGAGSDFLFGGFVADDIHGGPGTDVICGLKGNDHIHGDDGTDLLFGEFFIDLSFLTGNDCIWGDDGIDLVVGDNFFDTSSGTDGGDDSLWGGNGIDIVIGDDVLSDIFSQTHLGGKDAIEGNKDIDILFGCGGDDDIHGNEDIDFAEGNGGDDIIHGDDGRDFQFCNTTVHVGNLLLGGHGKDEVYGGKGIDVIFGNEGNDKLIGADQVDIMFGSTGDDEMRGDAGGQICTINGVPVRIGNLMFGGSENDKMWAGGDLDVMFGQDGNDQIRGYDGSGQQPLAIDADLLFGGNGDDYMEGDDESTILTNSIDFMFGGDGNDQMRGGSQPDFMFGGKGKDRMQGDSNSLLLIVSIDLMFGGPDDDRMDGGNALDLMFGQGGNDTMLGDDETVLLISPDFMFGGLGDDTMNGGCSLDFMFGEDGADHMLGDSNYLWEPLSADFMWGGPGPDDMDGGNAMDFMWGGSDCDKMLGDNSTPVRISADFMFGQTGNDDMDGGNSTDFMWGGDDNDMMVGDRQLGQPLSLDWMWGNDGCDTMLGGQALDWMWGGPGVDQMDGRLGPDMMFGNANSDIMNGGDLLDFIWGNEGNDLIHGNDWPDFIFGNDGDDCLYGDDGQDLIWGDAGNDCIHGGSHVDLLFGNDGDDLIFGDNGADFLFGGSGDDKLDGGGSFDFIFGGTGQDEGWRGPGGAVFFSVENKHNGSSGLDCDCRVEVCTGKICIRKFNDLNGDGIQNNGEPGLQNWTFQVSANQVSANCVGGTLITDANGNVCGDFFAGTYTVVEQAQSGWTATTPTTQTVTVQPGQVVNLFFGNKREGCDLLIRKSINPNPAQVGQQVTVTLTVINIGTGACQPGPFPWTVVQDSKPPGLTFNLPATISQSGGSANWLCSLGVPSGNLSCATQDPLPPGYAATFTFTATVTAPPGSTIQNCATVTNANDINSANNQSCVTLQVTGCVKAPSDMVAWWPMDDPTGDSVVDDIAGAPDNGSPKPGPTIGPPNQPASVPAVVGTGLNFLPGISPSGPNHYVEVATSPEVNFGTSDFTIDAWIKLGQAGNIHSIVDKLDLNAGRGYALLVQGGNLLLRVAPDSGGGLVGAVSTGQAITSGVWHHVAMTVRRNDPSNKPLVTFYIDGLLSGSGPTAGPLMPGSISIDTTTPLWIGGNSRLHGQGTVGLGEIAIDELEFFKRELNQTEIKAIFNAKSAGKCK